MFGEASSRSLAKRKKDWEAGHLHHRCLHQSMDDSSSCSFCPEQRSAPPEFPVAYEDVNQNISKAAITKLAWHLCYLSEDLIGLAFVLQECACSCETTCGPSLTATRRPSLEKPEWPACTNLVSRLHFHDSNHQCNTRVDNTGSVDKEFLYVPRVLWTRSPVCRKLSKKSRIVQLTPLRTRLTCNFPFFCIASSQIGSKIFYFYCKLKAIVASGRTCNTLSEPCEF